MRLIANMLVIVLWHLILPSMVLSCLVAAYRLLFHPLRKVPGPKLASMTGLYRFYYDIVKRGGYLEKLQRLHEIYGTSHITVVLRSGPEEPSGPIVRVGPHEVPCHEFHSKPAEISFLL
jgi:hypothetical protein